MRKKRSTNRQILPDPKFNDPLVAEFINCVMKEGRKHVARRLVYDSISLIEEKTKNSGLEVFRKALHNARPLLEVRARRVGGATYQVPTEVRQSRSVALAIRWIINYASERKDRSFSQKLAAELLAAASGEGSTIKKKEDVHKMAEANKAFAHYKW